MKVSGQVSGECGKLIALMTPLFLVMVTFN
jgi:hypothetical protein